MADTLQFDAQHREARGRHLRRLRRQGVTPIHIYGRGVASIAAQVDTPVLRRVVIAAGHNSPVTVSVDGAQHFTFIREIQKDPVTGDMLHVDFLQVDALLRMQSRVPLRLDGEATAIRLHRGEVSFVLRDITVECLPADVPHEFVVDVSSLAEIGAAVHVSEITAPSGVTILTDPEEVVARISAPTVRSAEEGAPEAGVAEGLEASAEGAEPAADEE